MANPLLDSAVALNRLYWRLVARALRGWHGLHAITVGQLTVGAEKTRSAFREDMVLRTVPFLLDLRDKSCLDLGCNDGFWSFRFGRFGLERLVGIDTSAEAIERANFLKGVYNFPRYEFRCEDLLHFLDGEGERFDIVLLLSIIYHLPTTTDWERFFSRVAARNNDALVIDSRWFDDDDYWYEKTTPQAVLQTPQGPVQKWRPKRDEVCTHLVAAGYERVIEIQPGSLLDDPRAFGNGNPYTLENVSDYLTGNRGLLVAFKNGQRAGKLLADRNSIWADRTDALKRSRE